MKVIAIAAVSRNGVIGKTSESGVGKLPWNIPEDLQYFRNVTLGQIVIMGRKSFDAIGRPLPKRENVVVTRNSSWVFPGVRVFHDLNDAVHSYLHDPKFMQSGKTIFVIGGAEIYKLSIPLLNEVWLTEIDVVVEGDAFFPHYQDGNFNSEFKKIESKGKQDLENPFQYEFVKYARKN